MRRRYEYTVDVVRPLSVIPMSYPCILCHKTAPALSIWCACRIHGLCADCHARATTDMRWHVMIPPDSELQRAVGTIAWQLIKWAVPLAVVLRVLTAAIFAKLPG